MIRLKITWLVDVMGWVSAAIRNSHAVHRNSVTYWRMEQHFTLRRAAEMLGELLPISDGLVSHATLRRHALAVTEPDEYDWPESRRDPIPAGTRLIVAIDRT